MGINNFKAILAGKRYAKVYKARAVKKKVIIFANCQGEALTKTLQESAHFNQHYEILSSPYSHEIHKHNYKAFIATIKTADVFIYQTLKPKKLSLFNSFSSEKVLKNLKKDALKISFSSIYFNAYFPHLSTMKGITGPLNRVHDYILAYCYYKDLSLDETLWLIDSANLYSKKDSLFYLEQAFKNLEQREEENKVDIPLSSFIKNNYQHSKLFHQFNHPNRDVFCHLAEKILNKLKLDSDLTLPGKEYLTTVSAPVYSSSHTHLELDFCPKIHSYDDKKIGTDKKHLVQKVFDAYKPLGKTLIYQYIITTKPFVIDLVDKALGKNSAYLFLKQHELHNKIQLTEQEIDQLRDKALEFEKKNDLNSAFQLMNKAHQARPSGPYIKQKRDHYFNQLNP